MTSAIIPDDYLGSVGEKCDRALLLNSTIKASTTVPSLGQTSFCESQGLIIVGSPMYNEKY